MNDEVVCAEREPQVLERIARWGAVADNLDALAGEVEQRLSNVLRDSSTPCPIDDAKHPEEDMVPLAASLFGIEKGLRGITSRLEDILSRLEV